MLLAFGYHLILDVHFRFAVCLSEMLIRLTVHRLVNTGLHDLDFVLCNIFLHQYVIEVHLIYKSLLGPHYFLCQLAILVMAEPHLWGVSEVLESLNETFLLL